MAMIIADTREDNGANRYLEACIAENNKTHVKLSPGAGGGLIAYQIKQITVGDYSILIKSGDSTVLAMIIERKTWKDLAASIKDDRIKHQHEQLVKTRDAKGCKIMYVIEGKMTFDDDAQIGHIAFKNLAAKVRHNSIRGVPFMQTKDEMHTAKLIVDLARDVMKLYSKQEISFPVTEPEIRSGDPGLPEQYIREIMSINQRYAELFQQSGLQPNLINTIDDILRDSHVYNVVPTPDVQILESFEIPTELRERRVYEDSDVTLRIWSSLPGVSNKSAITLQEKYHISDIVCATGTQIRTDIAGLKFPGGRRFGDAMAAKITDVGYNGQDQARLASVITISRTLMTGVPGISDTVANAILDSYKLRDICNGFVQSDMLIDLLGSRRIRSPGKKALDKLVELFIRPELRH